MGTVCCSSRNMYPIGLEEDEETLFSSEFYEYTLQGPIRTNSPGCYSYSLFNRCASEISLSTLDTPQQLGTAPAPVVAAPVVVAVIAPADDDVVQV